MGGDVVTLFLCGDVMLGRGVDQILPHPGDPALHEAYVQNALAYVHLAEEANGPIPRPVGYSWPWGEALAVLDETAPDARVVNLETSITRSGDFAPGKGVHYRMNPENLPCLTAAGPDVCVLANNHTLDFGLRGLEETLAVLAAAGLRTAGAGRDAEEARRPAIVPTASGGRVLVFSFGMPSSGIPHGWAARKDRPGIGFLPSLDDGTAREVVSLVQQARRPGDTVVVSVHWGPNWGYRVLDRVRFAHTLADGGVDVVHGHSSHHPQPVEVYGGKLILYGCGDFIDDYEGIGGYPEYRDDLRLMWLVSVAADTGRTTGVRMVPLRARRMRLEHAPPEDREWLRRTLDRISEPFGTRIGLRADGLYVHL